MLPVLSSSLDTVITFVVLDTWLDIILNLVLGSLERRCLSEGRSSSNIGRITLGSSFPTSSLVVGVVVEAVFTDWTSHEEATRSERSGLVVMLSKGRGTFDVVVPSHGSWS